jgi:GDSL-like lipase/acylhydrolase family protein
MPPFPPVSPFPHSSPVFPVPHSSPVFSRFVALGDSSTEGLDDPDGRGGYRGWANRLAERIAESQGGLLYANLAVRGLSTRQIRERQLTPAVRMQPDLVTLFSGTNDVVRRRFDPAGVAADVEAMHRALIGQGAVLLTFTLPDLTPVMPAARWIAPRVDPGPAPSWWMWLVTRWPRIPGSGATIDCTPMRSAMPGSPRRSPRHWGCREPTRPGPIPCPLPPLPPSPCDSAPSCAGAGTTSSPGSGATCMAEARGTVVSPNARNCSDLLARPIANS